jgi:hypothetical protein
VELPVNDFGQIQFSSGGTSWYTNGDVQPGTVSRYWLSAPAGQQVSAWLSVDGASADAPLAELAVSTAGAASMIISAAGISARCCLKRSSFTWIFAP